MENNMSVESTEASRESFWTLLNEKQYTICIPRIQRDYAQGREEPEPTQIRQAFIQDVFYSLTNDAQMDINFIYGNIDKDKKGKERFIPIDGQQRLTTLFLIHWYFASWNGKIDSNTRDILGRFQYETRFTTGDFCNRLVNDVNIDLKKLIDTDEKITNVIKDYYWFFSSYEHDATIKAMLVMIEDIHTAVKNLEDRVIVDSFIEKLTSIECPINFLFLNIADVGLTDEIYIKMNARGKALTRFENFKAQLTGYLSKYDVSFSQEFIGNINGTWSQFFWHEEYRPDVDGKDDKKSTVFDDQIMNLFRFVMMNEYISNVEVDDASTDTKYLVRRMLLALSKENDFQFVNRLFTDEFRTIPYYKTEEPNVDEQVFRFINKLLNILAKRKEETGNINFANNDLYDKGFICEENYFRRLIRSVNEKVLSYEDRILLYSEFCFLVKYANDDYSFDKTDELTEWMRYIYNLTRNMLYNGYDDYFRSIRRVRKIVDSDEALDILSYAAKLVRSVYKEGSGYGFVENQMMEESIKANLILRGDSWRKLITEAEKSFMGSQIAALLSFSEIWKLYVDEMEEFEKNNPDKLEFPEINTTLNLVDQNNKYMTSFELYLEKVNRIFDKESIKIEFEKESLLRRALLTYGGSDSYMLPVGKPVICFLDMTDRDTSFRRLFRGDSPTKRDYFKMLLDDIDVSKDIKMQLQQIIDDFRFDSENKWKQYFIEMPEILECMYQNKDKTDPDGRFVFLNPKRYICKRNSNQILLLEKTMTTSTNREYYSYVLYLKAKKKGLNVSYFTTHTENAEKYLFYTNKEDKEIQVIYKEDPASDAKEYKYIARENGIERYKGNIDNMLDYIEQQIK